MKKDLLKINVYSVFIIKVHFLLYLLVIIALISQRIIIFRSVKNNIETYIDIFLQRLHNQEYFYVISEFHKKTIRVIFAQLHLKIYKMQKTTEQFNCLSV